uniref:Uncharacterized protein n=1 Tax=Glossina austeni TaxID=7395 RepID=A0A1A9UV05_GLOAU
MYDKDNPPKFPMHDMHLVKSLKNCVAAVAVSLASGALVYMFHSLPRKIAYRNFYADYDPQASFKRMSEGGYLQSALVETSFKGKKNYKENLCRLRIPISRSIHHQSNVFNDTCTTSSEEVEELSTNISDLLNAISAELRGNINPRSNEFLETELGRYKTFIKYKI